jgi:FecR protein
MAPDRGKTPRRAEDDLFDWFTVSYKTLYTVAGVLVVLAGIAGYYYFIRNHAGTLPAAADTVAPSQTHARFTSIEGTVKVKAVGTFEWVAADPSMVLRRSDLVRTGSGAAAEITFFDGSVVHVRPDSLITIEETSEDPSTKRRKVVWHISSGEVNFETVKRNVPGSATEVSTPTVKSTVGELSQANIRVAEAGDSDFRLYRGSTQVQSLKTGDKVELAGGQAVRFDAGGKASAKVALPQVPAILAPPHQAEIAYPDPARATTLLAWRAVPGAASYHLMLDYNATFNRPLVDRRNIKDNSQELRGLDVGKYFWRVAVVDKDNVEGPPSDVARFSVVPPSAGTAADPPPLAIDLLDVRTNILQVKGRTEPGGRVTVNGQPVDVQNDGSFNEFITMQKPGKQVVVVRATGINGGVAEQRRPIVVGY